MHTLQSELLKRVEAPKKASGLVSTVSKLFKRREAPQPPRAITGVRG